MSLSQIKIIQREPLEIKLKVKRAPLFVLSCLWVVLVLMIALPLAGISYAIIWGNGPHIGFLFMLSVVFILARFLVRTILWNTYGSELLTFGKEEFNYQADYKYFKGPVRSLIGEYQPFYYFHDDEDKQACIGVRTVDDEVLAVTKLPIAEVEKVWEEELCKFSTIQFKDIQSKES